jgi:uncharacterized protein (DUF1684 family)
MASSPSLELVDWRRRVAELFAALRARAPGEDTLRWFREQKDTLFRTHAQSPIPLAERSSFGGLTYWSHDPAMRVTARFEPRDVEPAGADQAVVFERIGDLHFALNGEPLMLPALWIVGYAGGLFVPFRDGTSGHETYGGGRYVLDTIKSADLGGDPVAGTVVLDFNYAYHPSCVYDPRWLCPLAPPDSRLALPIRAGERLP